MVTDSQDYRHGPDVPSDRVPDRDRPEDVQSYTIQIDRKRYAVRENPMTGADLRRVPTPPVPPDRDLFQIIPGRPDRKIEDDDRISIADGMRFFTAPNTINPGTGAAG